MRTPRALAVMLSVAAAVVPVACGGDDDGSSGDARTLLEQAFSTPVESGRIDLGVDVQVDGIENLREGIGLELSGPFESNGPRELPSADLDVTVSGGGQSLSGGIVLTRDNGYLSFAGQPYELGEELVAELTRGLGEGDGATLAELGIDPADWVAEPQIEGEEDVAGAETTKVSGEIDVPGLVEDLGELTERAGPLPGGDPPELGEEEREQLAETVEDARLEAFVDDDEVLRRLVVEVEFEVPEGEREELGGAEGGAAKLDLTLSEVGEPQEIEPPSDARPLPELLQRFGLGPETFRQ